MKIIKWQHWWLKIMKSCLLFDAFTGVHMDCKTLLVPLFRLKITFFLLTITLLTLWVSINQNKMAHNVLLSVRTRVNVTYDMFQQKYFTAFSFEICELNIINQFVYALDVLCLYFVHHLQIICVWHSILDLFILSFSCTFPKLYICLYSCVWFVDFNLNLLNR